MSVFKQMLTDSLRFSEQSQYILRAHACAPAGGDQNGGAAHNWPPPELLDVLWLAIPKRGSVTPPPPTSFYPPASAICFCSPRTSSHTMTGHAPTQGPSSRARSSSNEFRFALKTARRFAHGPHRMTHAPSLGIDPGASGHTASALAAAAPLGRGNILRD